MVFFWVRKKNGKKTEKLFVLRGKVQKMNVSHGEEVLLGFGVV